jgi:hypothetical protein
MCTWQVAQQEILDHQEKKSVKTLRDLTNGALSRRTFLTGAGTAAAAAVVVGCGTSSKATPTPPQPVTQPAYTDADILNFALNLEYLEAEFYMRAATGTGLPAADIGMNPGSVTGGAQIANLTAREQQYVNTLAQDEYNHVKFLRAALGSAAIDRPQIDLTNSFNGLITAATTGSASPMTTFNPFMDFNHFLLGGFVFEDVGVTAYMGGAGALTKNSPYLSAAASILAIEGYHAGMLRTLIVGTSLTAAGLPGDQTYINLADAIQKVRASLTGGSGVASGGELTLMSGITAGATAGSVTVGSSTIVNADASAVAFARTFDQVLHIVYATPATSAGAAAGVSSGGFFPAGLNGNIKQTYS